LGSKEFVALEDRAMAWFAKSAPHDRGELGVNVFGVSIECRYGISHSDYHFCRFSSGLFILTSLLVADG
jgi:hypothetical protein